MSSRVRPWVALGVLAFLANAAVRPAIAVAADAPAGPPAAAPAPAAPAQPYPAAPPGQPYPPQPYGYPPQGYAPPGYAPYPPYPGAGYGPPMQLTKVHKVRRGLVTGGAVTFGVTWGIAASVSFVYATDNSCSGSSCSEADYLWIPIAGPMIVGLRESGSDGPGPFILWSLAQAAGVTMFVIGMVGHDVMEYRVAKGGPTLHLAPMFARDSSGMALTARW